MQQILLNKEIGEEEINELLEIVYNIPEFTVLKRYIKRLERKALKSIVNIPKRNNLEFLVEAALEDL